MPSSPTLLFFVDGIGILCGWHCMALATSSWLVPRFAGAEDIGRTCDHFTCTDWALTFLDVGLSLIIHCYIAICVAKSNDPTTSCRGTCDGVFLIVYPSNANANVNTNWRREAVLVTSYLPSNCSNMLLQPQEVPVIQGELWSRPIVVEGGGAGNSRDLSKSKKCSGPCDRQHHSSFDLEAPRDFDTSRISPPGVNVGYL